MTASVHVARCGALCRVTLDRPKAVAIDAATSRALDVAFCAFQDDPEAREVPRAFAEKRPPAWTGR